MRSLLSFALLALALLAVSPTSAQAPEASALAEMLEAINEARAEAELPPLERDAALDAVARAHTLEMVDAQELTHVSATSGTPQQRVSAAGVEATSVAENVAMHHDVSAAQAALLASEAHRANMLSDDLTHVGLGAVRAGDFVYVTQLFAERATEEPESTGEVERPASDFALIPPFVEQVARQAGELVAPALAVPEAEATAPDRPSEVEDAALPATTAGTSVATASAEPATVSSPPATAETTASRASDGTVEPSPPSNTEAPTSAGPASATSPVQQLFGIARALLGG